MNIPFVFWLVPFASVCALAMAWYFFKYMMKEDEGTDRMKEIAGYVRIGAMAYLRQQYKVVTLIFIILCVTGVVYWLLPKHIRRKSKRLYRLPFFSQCVLTHFPSPLYIQEV